MLKESFPLALALFVDLVDADLLVPRGDCQMVTCRRETQIRDAVLWGRVQCDIFGDITGGVGLAGRGGANISEQRHSVGSGAGKGEEAKGYQHAGLDAGS